MIFWVLTGALVIGWIWFTVSTWIYDTFDGLLALLVGGLLAGLAWLVVPFLLVGMGGQYLLGANTSSTREMRLKALGSDSSVEGRFFFLGGGYVDGKRVLSYIRENENGSFTTDQADGAASEVFEADGVEPRLVVTEHVSDRWWLAPPMSVGTTYAFTVPTGSVAEGYEVTP